MERIMLVAEKGKVYTNGIIGGKALSLPEGCNADEFRQITEAEWEEIKAARTNGGNE